MKRLFIAFTVIAGLSFSAKAQEFGFKKGDILLEGSVGFNSTNDKNAEEKTSSFNFSPKAGYFLSDKVAVGVALSIASEKDEDYSTGGSTTKTNSFGVGVFGRYYFLELGKRFKTYTEAGLGYATSKTEVGSVTGPKTNTLGFNLGVGANYFVTERLALNVGLTNLINVNSSKVDVSGAKATTNFGAQLGGINNIFNLATFGLAYRF
ncbi:MAG TPA: OmpW family outer membrane protein [Pelobium sp.]|nr:OmpW family outer membrane protein [Pelobium sp.]